MQQIDVGRVIYQWTREWNPKLGAHPGNFISPYEHTIPMYNRAIEIVHEELSGATYWFNYEMWIPYKKHK